MNTAELTRSLMIIDDHLLIAQGLAACVADRGITEPTVVDPTVNDVLEAVEAALPDIVLLDADFGDGLRAGISLIGPITERRCRVIVFTGINDKVLYGECLDRGAEMVLHKSAPLDAVANELARACAGEEIGDDSSRFAWYRAWRDFKRTRSNDLAPFESLTPREAEVLASLLRGHAAEEIATRSFVSVSTVRSQMRSLFTKLDVRSQLAAVAKARSVDWVPPQQT
ncbi:MAG: response regulator transcription factor [Acidimicrobiia bacterium]|nr:response regulator transcription factor [Acidimicrobiia bacterium]